MKICYLGYNGSIHNQKWIEALSQNSEIELHVISPGGGVMFENVRYYRLYPYTRTRLDYILNLGFLKKLLKKIKPDLLHAHYATSYGFMAARTGFHPLVITGWGADIFDSPSNLLMKLMLKYSFAKGDAITVLSKIALREIKKITDKNVLLIPFGVDVQKFCPAGKRDAGKFRIGTIRTLSEKYGVEYLVRAFARVHRNFPDTVLEIVGDGELKPYLQKLCVDLQVQDSVIFYGHINQKTDFEKYYRILSGLDAFAILSVLDSETFGVAAVEASACGIPVIATRVGGLPEVIIDGETGILVAPRNVEETEQAIKKLISDKELRSKMGKAGREHVLKLYDWNESVRRMTEVYKSLVSK